MRSAEIADEALQREARALGDLTRYRIFRYIVDAAGRVSVAELTEFGGLNHNSVRQHLGVLKNTNLVVEEVEDRARPGRPRLLYRPHPEALDRWGTTGAYSWLAALLANALRHGQEPRQAGRQEGHRRAAELPAVGDRADLLESEMERWGFRPSRVDKGRRIEFVLGRCPFADVAAADPDTVCQLHLGLTEGLAEGLGGAAVERLVAKDARQAGCRLVVEMTLTTPGCPVAPSAPSTTKIRTSGRTPTGRRRSV